MMDDVKQTPTFDDDIARKGLRASLVDKIVPYFEGDDADGIISYCRKLEGYILNG